MLFPRVVFVLVRTGQKLDTELADKLMGGFTVLMSHSPAIHKTVEGDRWDEFQARQRCSVVSWP